MRSRNCIALICLISIAWSVSACKTTDTALEIAKECIPQAQALAACVKENTKPPVPPAKP